MDLSRLNEIGCMLFNHDRNRVVGKILRAWVENGRGKAEIEFDEDEESEKIYQKVKSGTLKGISVGYTVDSWEDVMAVSYTHLDVYKRQELIEGSPSQDGQPRGNYPTNRMEEIVLQMDSPYMQRMKREIEAVESLSLIHIWVLHSGIFRV